MPRMRAWVHRVRVRILDHSPALELLVDADGVVRGAAGFQRQLGRDYRVAAGSVVLATGGCAFLSGALGTNVNTEDGALMAAEVGARFSGMEFSNAYAIVAKGSTITKTAYYGYATFFHEDGPVLEGAGSQRGRSVIARALRSERVFAQLDRADAAVRERMRLGQPNFFLQFDRRGVDRFRQRFEVDMLAEGTVRGTGGIDVVDEECATSVPGLFAAGDAATRERICRGSHRWRQPQFGVGDEFGVVGGCGGGAVRAARAAGCGAAARRGGGSGGGDQALSGAAGLGARADAGEPGGGGAGVASGRAAAAFAVRYSPNHRR